MAYPVRHLLQWVTLLPVPLVWELTPSAWISWNLSPLFLLVLSPLWASSVSCHTCTCRVADVLHCLMQTLNKYLLKEFIDHFPSLCTVLSELLALSPGIIPGIFPSPKGRHYLWCSFYVWGICSSQDETHLSRSPREEVVGLDSGPRLIPQPQTITSILPSQELSF